LSEKQETGILFGKTFRKIRILIENQFFDYY